MTALSQGGVHRKQHSVLVMFPLRIIALDNLGGLGKVLGQVPVLTCGFLVAKESTGVREKTA